MLVKVQPIHVRMVKVNLPQSPQIAHSMYLLEVEPTSKIEMIYRNKKEYFE